MNGDSLTGGGRFIRLGGLAVLLAVLIHILVNGFLKQFPPENPSPTELEAYLSAEVGTWAIVHGLRYPALVGLVLFAAAAYIRTCRSNAASVVGWGIVGLLGVTIQAANAFVANAIEIMAFRDFSQLSESSDLFWVLFYTVRVLFTAELTAWGLVTFGFSMAGFQSRSLPRWLAFLGLASGILCLGSGILVYPVIGGSGVAIVVDIAALGGLLWFVCTGIVMLVKGDR